MTEGIVAGPGSSDGWGGGRIRTSESGGGSASERTDSDAAPGFTASEPQPDSESAEALTRRLSHVVTNIECYIRSKLTGARVLTVPVRSLKLEKIDDNGPAVLP